MESHYRYSEDARDCYHSQERVMPYGGIEHSTNSRVSALLRDGSHNIQIRPYFGVGGTRHPQQLVCFTEENWVKQSLGGGGGSAEKQRAYTSYPAKLIRMPLCENANAVTDSCKVGKGEKVTMASLKFPDYSKETIRLQSFKHWGGVLPAQELAEGGFFMIARRDVVKCFSCDVILRDWERSDNVIDEHQRHSPDCSFLKTITYSDDSTSITKASPIKVPCYDPPELSSAGDNCFHSSKLTISSSVKDNQEDMIAGSLHYPDVGSQSSQDEDSESSREFFLSPKALSVDSRSGSPRTEQCQIAGTFHEVGEGIPKFGQWDQLAILCQICHTRKINCVLLPCGHTRTCEECGAAMQSFGQRCPQCKASIYTVHRAFL